MRYTGLLAAVLAVLCLTCACENQDSNKEYNTVATQTGAQYHSSWMTGIAKADACQNAAIADWLELCAAPERDDIGHYVLHNKVHKQDNTFTHHLLTGWSFVPLPSATISGIISCTTRCTIRTIPLRTICCSTAPQQPRTQRTSRWIFP